VTDHELETPVTGRSRLVLELGLLVTHDTQLAEAAGKSFLLRGFRVVDETLLDALGVCFTNQWT
jgi:hypothetical protein